MYGYKEGTIVLSEEFDYNTFIDSVSGYVKFILENLNFLTFEEDRSKILKVKRALTTITMSRPAMLYYKLELFSSIM